jgi:hypothetical protein
MGAPQRKKARLALEKAQNEAAQLQTDNKTTTNQ